MSQAATDFTKLGFAKTFVLPALWIFLIPTLSLLFFLHAQNRYDSEAKDSMLRGIAADRTMNAQERAEAEKKVREVPLSSMIHVPEMARQLPSSVVRDYTFFYWMIRVSFWSIVSAVGVFAVVGLCVVLSMRSQWIQYLCLSIGWHVLRIYGALQAIAQGVMLVALSYWVTALWMNFYAPKLIFLAAAVAALAVFALIVAIFRWPKSDFTLEGKLITDRDAPQLAADLRSICSKMNTTVPDQIIAGIDDNFFVTEQPVLLDGKKYKGRTLYISLALLKQLQTGEATAVLAHEMAHFSGNDTLYSRRIAPLLIRYGNYLQALANGGVTRPIYYFMVCFRALFEVSLGKLSREREFRADRLAAEMTTPNDLAGALLRIVAYSKYRANVESELFGTDKMLEAADVGQRVERGFPQFAVSFAREPDLGTRATAHPFDSHPPLTERLNAVGVALNPETALSMLGSAGECGWYNHIPNAGELESQQWQVYEERFKSFHEQTLPFRLLPDTDEEREIVAKAFPQVVIEGLDGPLTVDYLQMMHPTWNEPLQFKHVSNLNLDDNGILTIQYTQPVARKEKLKTKRFKNAQQVVDTIGRYFFRYQSAAEWIKQKQAGSGKE